MKTKNYIDILKLRKYLQALGQISYSYSQINKTFSPLELQEDQDLKQVKKFYLDLIAETKTVITQFENEYDMETADTN